MRCVNACKTLWAPLPQSTYRQIMINKSHTCTPARVSGWRHGAVHPLGCVTRSSSSLWGALLSANSKRLRVPSQLSSIRHLINFTSFPPTHGPPAVCLHLTRSLPCLLMLLSTQILPSDAFISWPDIYVAFLGCKAAAWLPAEPSESPH